MWSRRSAILMLVAGFLLASSTTGVRDRNNRTKHNAARVARACEKQTRSLSTPGPSSLSIDSSWRSRLKSVLEETGPRTVEESDLGPVATPSHVTPFVSSGSSLSRRLAPVPLRC